MSIKIWQPKFGKYLKELREKRKVSQVYIEKCLDMFTGHYYRIEKGRQKIVNPANLERLANFFGCGLEKLKELVIHPEERKPKYKSGEFILAWLKGQNLSIEDFIEKMGISFREAELLIYIRKTIPYGLVLKLIELGINFSEFKQFLGQREKPVMGEGELLRDLRKRLYLSQTDVAKMTGLHRASISLMEHQKHLRKKGKEVLDFLTKQEREKMSF